LRLELLDHARADLLPLNNHTLAIAVRARLNIVRVVGTAAAAVRADHIPIVLQLKVRARVKFLE